MDLTNDPHALAVWSSKQKSGLLRQRPDLKHVFAYDTRANNLTNQVSLTMPIRLESWQSRDLHPIFQMNLPEGALLEAIRRAVAKIAGADDLTVLRVTGGNQIGRNRFSLPESDSPAIVETPESLDDLLTYPDTEELFHDLISRYAVHSGVSGVQPKVMLEASERGTATVGGYIVKSWGTEYPQLAANEFFCMTVARKAGLPVPEFHLSANGGLFVMRRFDFTDQGVSLGFEDMCSLQAVGTSQKYSSTYERVARTIKDFVSKDFLQRAREQFFATLALSSVLRNGDAHLKNFGVLYEYPGTPVRLAPVYDIVTTTVYVPKDVPALSLAGSKKWWSRKMLEQFAVIHLNLSVGQIAHIFDVVLSSVADTKILVIDYINEHPEFSMIGEKMLSTWESGLVQYSRSD